MTDAIFHRGPDDAGVWLDESAGIALGHRRLSILDLSSEGHQPMVSACGRYVIAFNGEIYNYRDIRRELDQSSPSVQWRGHSDTEVMLAAFSQWGLETALGKFVGMFAFALWDRGERVLRLARDRVGEKPLYYGWMENVFLFGSELKALRAHPAWHGKIDRDVLALYLRHSYVPAPYTIYRGIHKLMPGTFLSIKAGLPGAEPLTRPFWSARAVAETGVAEPFQGNEQEAIDTLETLLRQSVQRQMVADVPLGAFLSGGYDSSAIVALMQAQSDRPVKTFTIGFHESGYNEAKHATAVARHLGTDHTELYVTPEEAMAVIPKLPSLYDEPFGDSSQIPTFLVSELARRHVVVSLSGDAGDELFAGYNRYFWGRNLWRRLGWLPASIRQAMAGLLTAVPATSWDGALEKLRPILPAFLRYKTLGDKLHKLAEILALPGPDAMYRSLVSHWKQPTYVVLGAKEPPTTLSEPSLWAELPDFTHRMMYLDLVSYLPDDILVKVDRAAMGVSLETRVPFLDHQVVEFAWRLPLSMKIRDGQGKWILRQLLYRYVPEEIVERPKMGFGVPIDAWLRGPLRDWAEDYLNERHLHEEGYFDPQPIREKWVEHLNGRRNWSYHLWDVLMFQTWFDEQRAR
jgi:asparagine synthase (glutamine-hydrolysing)